MNFRERVHEVVMVAVLRLIDRFNLGGEYAEGIRRTLREVDRAKRNP